MRLREIMIEQEEYNFLADLPGKKLDGGELEIKTDPDLARVRRRYRKFSR